MSINNLPFFSLSNVLTIILVSVFSVLSVNYIKNKRNDNLTIKNDRVANLKWIDDSTLTLKLKQDTVVPFNIKFKNGSRETLYIRKLKATCGCTLAEVSNEKILPGQIGYIRGNIDTKNKTGSNLSIVTFYANTIAKNHKVLIRYEVK